MNVPRSEEDFSSRSIQVTFHHRSSDFPSLRRADWVGVGQSNREQLEFIFEHSAAQSQLERNGKIRYKENIAAGKRRYARTVVHDFEAHKSNYETETLLKSDALCCKH